MNKFINKQLRKQRKEKGFLFTVTIFLILTILLIFLSNFAERQLSYQAGISKEIVSCKVTHIWEDVQEDLNNLWGLNITKIGDTLIIEDIIPAVGDPGEMLAAYGEFVETYYETNDVELSFLDPAGNEMNLSDLSSKLRIEPMGLEYGYPDFGKNELQLEAPVENVTSISNVSLIFVFNNDTLNGTQWDPAPQSCTGTRICIPFYIEIDSQVIRDAPTPVNKKSTLSIDCTEGGPSCISIIIGETSPQGVMQNVFDIRLQTQKLANLSTDTSLLLNTSEFSVNYMSKLRALDINYNIKREDWMQS